MNKKLTVAIVGVAVAISAMILSPMLSALAQPDYLTIVSAEVGKNKKKDTWGMEVELAGDATSGIPNAYGYAALTDNLLGILAVTTHEVISKLFICL